MSEFFIGLITKFVAFFFGTRNERMLKEVLPLVDDVNNLEPEIQALPDEELAVRFKALKARVQDGEDILSDPIVTEALALAREAGKRSLEMRAFDVQITGAIAMHRGRIAEMVTGEGKTLVIAIAAALNALAKGDPKTDSSAVHVVTYNDFLASRDPPLVAFNQIWNKKNVWTHINAILHTARITNSDLTIFATI